MVPIGTSRLYAVPKKWGWRSRKPPATFHVQRQHQFPLDAAFGFNTAVLRSSLAMER